MRKWMALLFLGLLGISGYFKLMRFSEDDERDPDWWDM